MLRTINNYFVVNYDMSVTLLPVQQHMLHNPVASPATHVTYNPVASPATHVTYNPVASPATLVT